MINVEPGSEPGTLIFNNLITPRSCRRLALLASAWQRIDWLKASAHLVALNGSLVQSGYTMGFIEDPEVTMPSDPKDTIPFLTALRSTTVRQNWVESTAGVQVGLADKPEMYTVLGTDVRRFSPGRIVVAVAGDVKENCTFQLMLRYTVRLYVPFAAPVAVLGGASGFQCNRGAYKETSALAISGLTPGIVPFDVNFVTARDYVTFSINDKDRVRYIPAGTTARLTIEQGPEGWHVRLVVPGELPNASYLWWRPTGDNDIIPMVFISADAEASGSTY